MIIPILFAKTRSTRFLVVTRSVIICACLLSGCYIAPYDLATDQGLSDIQRKVDAHLAEAPSRRPEDFYGPIKQEIHSLSIRLNARQQGDLSIDKENQALSEISGILDDMQSLESRAATRPVVPQVWNLAQEEFDQSIGDVLGLELKRK